MSDSLSEKIPFTQLIDIINNGNFPLDYRIEAASFAKLAIQKQLTLDGGRVEGNVRWMLSMIAREREDADTWIREDLRSRGGAGSS